MRPAPTYRASTKALVVRMHETGASAMMIRRALRDGGHELPTRCTTRRWTVPSDATRAANLAERLERMTAMRAAGRSTTVIALAMNAAYPNDLPMGAARVRYLLDTYSPRTAC